MQVIVYNISPDVAGALLQANNGKHQISQQTGILTVETAKAAAGNEVLIVLPENALTGPVLHALKAVGVKYLAATSKAINNIDLHTAWPCGFKIANIAEVLPEHDDDENWQHLEMQQVVRNLDLWEAGKCVGKACCCANNCGTKSKNVKDHDNIAH